MRLLFLLFCTSAGFQLFASNTAATVEEDCFVYVICEGLEVLARASDEDCTASLTAQDLVSSYGTSCGFAPSLYTIGATNLGLGVHNVTVVARYGSRFSSCRTRVRVEDKTDPEVNCQDVTVYTVNPDNISDPQNWFTYEDNCGIEFAINYNEAFNGFGTFGMGGAVTDYSGNSASCGSDFIIRPIFDPYCAVDANPLLGYINEVEIGNTRSFTQADNGYGYYPNRHFDLTIGDTESIELEPGYTFYNYRMYWRVYIDLNNDWDFEDTNELIYEGNGIGRHTGNFQVPNYGVHRPQGYRMRVVMSYGGYASLCTSSRIWGEVEDYTVGLFELFNPWGGRPIATTSGSTIYPNPLKAGELPQLQLPTDHAIDQLVLANSLGQEVARIQVTGEDAQNLALYEAQTAMQEAGIYWLTAVGKDGQRLWTKRWLVQ